MDDLWRRDRYAGTRRYAIGLPDRNRGAPLIEPSIVQRVLSASLRTGGDFAEVFVEDRRSSSARLDDGRVEQVTSGRDRGAGIRVVVGDTTGFAHTADLSEAGLLRAAEAASAAARSGGGGTKTVELTKRETTSPYAVQILPETVAKARKVELLQRADAGLGPRATPSAR